MEKAFPLAAILQQNCNALSLWKVKTVNRLEDRRRLSCVKMAGARTIIVVRTNFIGSIGGRAVDVEVVGFVAGAGALAAPGTERGAEFGVDFPETGGVAFFLEILISNG